MNGTYWQLDLMLGCVANALGNDLLSQVAFTGGSVMGLLITDEFIKESIRHTEDVDLIVEVIGYAGWNDFQRQLKKRGFRHSMQDNIMCRMRLNGLVVDFMPDNADILGFTNRWYKDALKTSIICNLNDNRPIRVVSPVYFAATKLEAYLGRGNNNPMSSQDVEDILNLFDGRIELVHEIEKSNTDVKKFIAAQLQLLLAHQDFDYVVQSTVKGNTDREELLLERLELVAGIA